MTHPCQTCKHFLPKPAQSTKTNRCNLYRDINPTEKCIYHQEKLNGTEQSRDNAVRADGRGSV